LIESLAGRKGGTNAPTEIQQPLLDLQKKNGITSTLERRPNSKEDWRQKLFGKNPFEKKAETGLKPRNIVGERENRSRTNSTLACPTKYSQTTVSHRKNNVTPATPKSYRRKVTRQSYEID